MDGWRLRLSHNMATSTEWKLAIFRKSKQRYSSWLWRMLNVLLAIVSFVFALLLVLLLVGIGWYIVWKLFLSRFRFVRELLVANNGASEVQGTPRTRNRKPRIDWSINWRVAVTRQYRHPTMCIFFKFLIKKQFRACPWLWYNDAPTGQGALQCCWCIRDVHHVQSPFMSWSCMMCRAYPRQRRSRIVLILTCVFGTQQRCIADMLWYICSNCVWLLFSFIC